MNLHLFLIDNDNVTLCSETVRIGPSIFQVLDADSTHVLVDIESPIRHLS